MCRKAFAALDRQRAAELKIYPVNHRRLLSRDGLPVAGLLCAITLAVFGYIFWKRIVLHANSDLHIHIAHARSMKSLMDIHSPHFLFQIALIALSKGLPISFELGAAILLGLTYAVMAVAVAAEIQRQRSDVSPAWAALYGFLCLLATHIFIATLFVPNFYYGYFGVTAYHNPTQQLNKMFALLIWFTYCRAFLSKRSLTPHVIATLMVLCLLSGIAKPSFLIVFLPLTGLVAVSDLLRGRIDLALGYATSIMLPSVLLLAWQYWMTYGSGGGLEVAPFVVVTSEYLYRLPLSLAFPLAATVLMWRDAARSGRFLLGWAAFVISFLYVTLLAETGPRRLQGNFGWSSQTFLFLLYVESLLLALAATGRRRRVLLAVFAVHVTFGAIFAIANAFYPAELWA
jgi:hypothetical protein